MAIKFCFAIFIGCILIFTIQHLLKNTSGDQELELKNFLREFQLQEYETVIKDSGTFIFVD